MNAFYSYFTAWRRRTFRKPWIWLIPIPLVWPLFAGIVPPTVPDSFLTRVELLALLQTLNAELLSHPSATYTLERWCETHHLAKEAKLTAHKVAGTDEPLPPALRGMLAINDAEPVRYRRVQLFCGEKFLSEADNWYVPARLTPEINRLLDESDIPFGRVVQQIDFHREILSATLLWSPLASAWEMAPAPMIASGSMLQIPDYVLEHRAILYTRTHVPFSAVVETYTSEVLAFNLPQAH